ncbi:putative zinc-binding metallopeptidase [Fertoebacter nigrum]|uniref:Putative zinc-binding metallopeptidase n=1 Tax=Fertoeibacter niger TaxID=2656921 RepID=A0A8X8HAL3_9RHOB|nr:putative zinc-binding metallopeptidase [Fertoeibacter niger]NUB46831.1 putative zinc-binding metallopeptidase [Fertoeibacter niger]
MKRFSCPTCGNDVHFENTQCLSCGAALVYVPEARQMLVLIGEACANRAAIHCNWPAVDGPLCECCAATETIPDQTIAANATRWSRIEEAKRRLYYSLISLGLPREQDELELRFRLLGDVQEADGSVSPVLTGHEDGLITLNIAEADDDEREARRLTLGEPYRTVLGHLRHEVGHFYWDVLVKGRDEAGFTALFGDASQDYQQALERHYAQGAPVDWPGHHVSAYAAAHPWEDFAETWAHYLHMVDGLETASRFGLGPQIDAYRGADPAELVAAWMPLSVAMNEMNRAMGQSDFYPFVLPVPVTEKLAYIHRLIHG